MKRKTGKTKQPRIDLKTRADLVEEILALTRQLRQTERQLYSSYRISDEYKRQASERPRCYACDAFAVGARDRRPEGGKIELACARHAEGPL